MDRWVKPVELHGSHVDLVPLAPNHAPALAEAAADGELHRLWYTTVPAPHAIEAEIARRLSLLEAGTMMPFCVIEPATGNPVGMTTYMNIDAANKRLEIGSTWNAASVQRTPLNTQSKRLLLGHAFETLGANAVEFRTHFMNAQSRRAIERIGAKLDGVLRSHMILANGTFRDTAVYSIIAGEWPAVRANLDWLLEKPRG